MDIRHAPHSLTGQYLSGRRSIAVPPVRTPAQRGRALRVVEATGNNLHGVTVEFPLGLLTCVTGVSGSGKSTLVNETLYAGIARQLGLTGIDAPKVDRIERHIAVTGELDPQMVERLLDIANRCPVHRILTHQPVIVSEISAVTPR